MSNAFKIRNRIAAACAVSEEPAAGESREAWQARVDEYSRKLEEQAARVREAQRREWASRVDVIAESQTRRATRPEKDLSPAVVEARQLADQFPILFEG